MEIINNVLIQISVDVLRLISKMMQRYVMNVHKENYKTDIVVYRVLYMILKKQHVLIQSKIVRNINIIIQVIYNVRNVKLDLKLLIILDNNVVLLINFILQQKKHVKEILIFQIQIVKQLIMLLMVVHLVKQDIIYQVLYVVHIVSMLSCQILKNVQVL